MVQWICFEHYFQQIPWRLHSGTTKKCFFVILCICSEHYFRLSSDMPIPWRVHSGTTNKCSSVVKWKHPNITSACQLIIQYLGCYTLEPQRNGLMWYNGNIYNIISDFHVIRQYLGGYTMEQPKNCLVWYNGNVPKIIFHCQVSANTLEDTQWNNEEMAWCCKIKMFQTFLVLVKL